MSKVSKTLILLLILDLNDLPWAPKALAFDTPGAETENKQVLKPFKASVIEAPPLLLTESEQRFLPIGKVEKFSLGAPLVRGRVLPNEPSPGLLIKGLKAGRTDLWVWKSDKTTEHRTVHVKKPTPQSQLAEKLEQMVGELQEVEVLTSGVNSKNESLYILKGEFQSLREASRIKSILSFHPDRIQNESQPSQNLYQKAAQEIKNWVQNSDFKNKIFVQTSSALRTIQLKGQLKDSEQNQILLQRAQSIYPFVQSTSLSTTQSKPVIHFKVYLLELRRTKFRSFGLDSPSSVESFLRVSSRAIQSSFDFQSTLQSLETRGEARVLSQPEITVRSPGEAELFAGGEMPIELRTLARIQVDWKRIGLSLKLKVIESSQDKVRVDISTEVSGLDPSLASSHIQGIRSNHLRTQIDADFDEPLFLCGLIQKHSLKSEQGWRWLKRLPVLGNLFGSDDYQKNKTELVAVLIPQHHRKIKFSESHSHQWANNPWKYFGE